MVIKVVIKSSYQKTPNKYITPTIMKVRNLVKQEKWDKSCDLSLELYRHYKTSMNFDNALKWLIHSLCYFVMEYRNRYDYYFAVKAIKTLKKNKFSKTLAFTDNIVRISASPNKLSTIAEYYELIGQVYLNMQNISRAALLFLAARNIYGRIKNWKALSQVDKNFGYLYSNK